MVQKLIIMNYRSSNFYNRSQITNYKQKFKIVPTTKQCDSL